MPNEKSFWESLPGILTGVAALITAVGGVVAIYYHGGSQAANPASSTSRDPAAHAAKVSNTSEKPPSCSPTYSEKGEVPGTRVLYFEPDASTTGAEVFLDGKCQGVLGSPASGRLAQNMLVNVPAGSYDIAVRRKGFQEYRSTATVPSTNTPPGATPKFILQIRLSPSY